MGRPTVDMVGARLVLDVDTTSPGGLLAAFLDAGDNDPQPLAWKPPDVDPATFLWLLQATAHAYHLPVLNRTQEAPSITCPRCHRTSWHPQDVEHGYCGACHAFTQ